MVNAEANKQLVIEHFNLMNQGLYIAALKDFADDMVWWCGGSDAHGGASTKQQLLDAYTEQLPKYFPNGFSQKIEKMFGEGDWVVAYGHNSTPKTGAGKPYFNHFAWIFQFREGKIIMLREYFDTAHAREALFAW